MAIEDIAAQAGVSVAHAIMRTISVVCVLLVVVGLGAAVYFGFIRPTTKPNPTTTQQGEQINNYNYEPRMTFGCADWRLLRPQLLKGGIDASGKNSNSTVK
jgi:hypothetical protein